MEDLLALLDIMEPVVELMERLERASKGEEGAYPRLLTVKGVPKPNRKFKGVTLLEGWVITKDDGKESGASRFTWRMRSKTDTKNDREKFANEVR